ncbi:MAG: hypothetical protein KKG59_02040, partial [Nanoarchaeota archaeon]|nr:hypothetical protein [Nanoarchaeota archaeon]
MFENDFGTPYDLNVYFIDPDDDPLEFEYRFLHERDVRPNDPFMDVTIVEGKVTIESKQGYKGIKSLRFTATDPSGEVAKSNAVLIGVAEKKIMCGDGLCYEENCTTCPTDCGRCDTCQEKWICGNWSNCNFGQMQTRLCKDLSDCKTSKDKPDLTRKCPYTCHDSIMNQDETSVDCGGVCKECPTCWDGKTNGNESGKDCGGECKACPAGAKCNTHLDCDSYVCAGSGICQAASCSDQTKNQGEQGIDCGPVCGNVCPSCFDEIKNQDEKGIDCGGSCEACATCSDHIKNQNEIKADCGGPCRVCTFEELYGISPKAIIVFLIMLLLFATLLAILERRYNFIFKSIGMNMSIDSLLFFNKFTSLFYFGKGKRQGVTEETIHNLKMLDSAEKGLDEKFLELLNGYYMTVFQVHDTFTHEQLYFKLKEYKMPDTARQLVILCYDTVQQYEKRKYRTHVEAHMLVHQAIKVLDAVKRYV